MRSRVFVISSALRRARRPDLAGRAALGAAAVVALGGRPGPRRGAAPDSARSSCREAPRMASRTAPAKEEARESSVERRELLGIVGAEHTANRPLHYTD